MAYLNTIYIVVDLQRSRVVRPQAQPNRLQRRGARESSAAAVLRRCAGALAGMRIGVIRESMIYPRGSKTEQPIVSAAAIEIKEVLARKLGATLVETQCSSETMKRDRDIICRQFAIWNKSKMRF